MEEGRVLVGPLLELDGDAREVRRDQRRDRLLLRRVPRRLPGAHRRSNAGQTPVQRWSKASLVCAGYRDFGPLTAFTPPPSSPPPFPLSAWSRKGQGMVNARLTHVLDATGETVQSPLNRGDAAVPSGPQKGAVPPEQRVRAEPPEQRDAAVPRDPRGGAVPPEQRGSGQRVRSVQCPLNRGSQRRLNPKPLPLTPSP